MICGIVHGDPSAHASRAMIKKMGESSDGEIGVLNILQKNNIALGSAALPHIQPESVEPAMNARKTIMAVFQGRIFNTGDLLKKDNPFETQAQSVIHWYEKHGIDFIEQIDGQFAFAIIDRNENKVILGRDRFGIEPLYYYFDAKKIIFGSTLRSLIGTGEVKKELNLHAVYQFLQFCYNPALYTFYKNIHKLRPGHYLIFNGNNVKVEPYWQLSFRTDQTKSEEEFCHDLIELLKDAVKSRIDKSTKRGVFLSGGMDSSTMTALISESARNRLTTFSFRCRGESFDESHYAKIVADYFRTRHYLTEYKPEDVELMTEIVKWMDEPFCDVGINIATYLLGRAAQHKVNCIYSGDGGDELFGGHPVYVADKAAQMLSFIPSFLLKPLFAFGNTLPDSDQKKNFIVKAKRFSESFQYPSELMSHRWRIYYTPNELRKLIHDDLSSQISSYDPFQVILRFNKEADGKDILSRSIYSDYQTVVGFYLRRMGLLKHLGIESRFPLLDRRLVEYAARIPSKLKIKGNSDSKYIFKKTMEDILPRDIVYRKDKLGHSIPMKNWMRSNPIVKSFVLDWLSESIIKERGFFNHEYIAQLIDDHMSKRKNNSHRMWALLVLELWLRENIG